ncbi:MAG: glycosyltransferase family 39 protein [Bacteroidales bacterium]|nr:glycosyltransferase family 39 protein [Bacteroidales bacterium]
MKRKQPFLLFGTLFGIVCFRTLLAFQGFDLCDEGSYITFFQQIFNAPQSVEYNFLYWFSGIIGGIWLKIFPDSGLFSFRILGILMHVLSLILLILIFRNRLSERVLALSCVVITLLSDYGIIAFGHNHLVVVLSLLTFYFLIKGIEQNRWLMLVLAGYTLVFIGFSRLPSFTLLAWILLIPMFSNDWKKSLKQIGLVCIGLVAGILDVFLIMWFFGHIEIFTNSIFTMFNIANHAEDLHGLRQLTSIIVQSYQSIGKYAVLLIGLVGSMFLISHFFKKQRWISYLCAIFIFGAFRFWMQERSYIFCLYAFCFLALALLFWKIKNKDKNLQRLILGAIIMMIFLPFGSDAYIGNMGENSIWLAIPLVLYFGFSHVEQSPVLHLTKQCFFGAFLSAFCVVQCYKIANQSYFDKGSRFEKRYAIHHPITKNIYTTKFRADLMNELIPVLKQYISPNDYVLAFEHIPMIHAITKSKPYLYSPWLFQDGTVISGYFLRAEQTLPLPIVVKQHFENFLHWSTPQDDYYAENKPNTYSRNSARIVAFNKFLKLHNYQEVWGNDYFSIWITKP